MKSKGDKLIFSPDLHKVRKNNLVKCVQEHSVESFIVRSVLQPSLLQILKFNRISFEMIIFRANSHQSHRK